MILPSKHLSQDRALLTVSAHILQRLLEPKTVSGLWDECLRQDDGTSKDTPPLHYDSFILALDLLFLIGTIELSEGLLARRKP